MRTMPELQSTSDLVKDTRGQFGDHWRETLSWCLLFGVVPVRHSFCIAAVFFDQKVQAVVLLVAYLLEVWLRNVISISICAYQ